MDKEYLDLCENAAYTKKRELIHKLRVAHAKQVLEECKTTAQARAISAGGIDGKNAEIRKAQLDETVLFSSAVSEAQAELDKQELELVDTIAEAMYMEAKLSITKAWLYSQARIT